MLVKPIPITEFRKNTKLLLDQARTKTLYIARNWEIYELKLVGDGTLAKVPELKEKLDTMPVTKPKIDIPGVSIGFCPHGSAKGLCKIDSCNRKYR